MSRAGAQHDRAIARVAGRQYGVITRAQLRDIGLGEAAVGHRISAARLHPVHRGVFALTPILPPNGHRLAAVLACGPGAVLSHKCAGEVWELLSTAQTKLDVTVSRTSARARPKIHIHRTRTLHPDDAQILDRIPITSVARTIVDLAGVLNPRQLLRVIEQAARLHRLDFSSVQAAIDRNRTHKGIPTLYGILAEFTGAPATRSELERAFLELVSDAGLPTPLVNRKVAGLEVDAHWPRWQLVVELDGRAYHSAPEAYERDRERDAVLQRAGYRVLRVTHKRLHVAPQRVIADIRALAALRAPES